MASEIERKYFANLDGLRFILAFMVLASHSMLGVSLCKLVSIDFFQRLITIFTSGHLGVSFFFVLSGFLITYLMFEEKKIQGKLNIKNFYIRRIFRIWPLYFCILIFTFFIYPLFKQILGYTDQNPFRLSYQAFFLSNFDNINVHQLGLINVAPLMISINWSVSIEEQFYLVWPLVFICTPPRKFWIVCVLLIIFSWFFRIYNDDGAIRYYHTFSVVCDLALGGFSAYLAFYNGLFLAFFEKLNKQIIASIYLLGIVILMYNDLLFSGFFVQTTFRILQAMFFCFIILEQSYSKHSLFKIKNLKEISSLGKYTFALYMLHPIGIQAVIIFFRYAGFIRDESLYFSLLYSGLSFLVSILLSICSYHLIEIHFLKWRKLFY